jgi:hypothetical protein
MSRPAATDGTGAMRELLFIDSHTLAVKAPPEQAWDEVARVTRRWVEQFLPRSGGAAGPLFARLLGCSEVDAPRSGPGVPEAIVGFRVARSERPSLIALVGEHRFSRYALIFEIEPCDGPYCVVKAETRAAFPGRAGRIYRYAVIGTGAHVFVVRRLLSSIKRRAERN